MNPLVSNYLGLGCILVVVSLCVVCVIMVLCSSMVLYSEPQSRIVFMCLCCNVSRSVRR